MKFLLLVLSFVSLGMASPNVFCSEQTRWEQQASKVTIIRDHWGIPHIYGKTDADVVFGLLYAHAEDDFSRIEMNYINAMGRLAEVAGESEVYRDLRMKLFIDPTDLKAQYQASPAWLKKLMNAYADGLNYYLSKHPEVHPKLITRFEPWMALSFSEGSIGGDIEEVSIKLLEEFYSKRPSSQVMTNTIDASLEPQGSNGFAIAPTNSASGHALLLINPHTSFYFRGEAQMVSEQGLNAYGAVTWGQFFIYQGFNQRNGWMHTSGGGDVIDEYEETIIEKDATLFYQYSNGLRPLRSRKIELPFKRADGTGLDVKKFTAYFSHHGPIVRAANGKWISVRLMNQPVRALTQSFLRTKTKDYASFRKVMELRTNSSNNTVYADNSGDIAYFHGNFIPVRDTHFDWSKPVDGSNPATEWKGLHPLKEIITLINPTNGWIQNTNNWPFSAAGSFSPKQEKFPAYMWTLPENPRGIHAVRMLENKKDFTLDSLISAAYDSKLTAFEELLPLLIKAYDAAPPEDAVAKNLTAQINILRAWDGRYSTTSIATTLAIYWGQELIEQSKEQAVQSGLSIYDYLAKKTTPDQKLLALAAACSKLERDFGSWKTAWGEVNRFQRINDDIVSNFDDNQASLPVAFTSATWGSLAAFGVNAKLTTRKIYGTRGNSFVAAVDFGPQVKAKAIMAGGQSGDPGSPHFNDQAEMYSKGQFRDVLFYPNDVKRAAERTYHPGH